MTIQEALQIVIDLARQNVIDEREMPEENARQLEAISVVENKSNIIYVIISTNITDFEATGVKLYSNKEKAETVYQELLDEKNETFIVN